MLENVSTRLISVVGGGRAEKTRCTETHGNETEVERREELWEWPQGRYKKLQDFCEAEGKPADGSWGLCMLSEEFEFLSYQPEVYNLLFMDWLIDWLIDIF